MFIGCDAFYRPGYVAELVPNWIPALDGVEAKLAAGGRIADLGCGLGSSSVLMAEAFPRSVVVGSDYHADSIELARKKAAEAGVADRVTFEVATAQTFSGSDYDLVTTFDALHDMGDPVGAARRVHEALAPDGTWLLVEPNASRRRRGELQPGRPALLRGLHVPLRAQRAVPARWLRPGRAGGRGGDPRRRRQGRLHALPLRGAQPVQPGLRDPSLTDHPELATAPRRPDLLGAVVRSYRGAGAMAAAATPPQSHHRFAVGVSVASDADGVGQSPFPAPRGGVSDRELFAPQDLDAVRQQPQDVEAGVGIPASPYPDRSPQPGGSGEAKISHTFSSTLVGRPTRRCSRWRRCSEPGSSRGRPRKGSPPDGGPSAAYGR